MIVSKVLMPILNYKNVITSVIQTRVLQFCLLKQFLADGDILKSRGSSREILKLYSHPREVSIYL